MTSVMDSRKGGETERDHAICVASFCFAAPRLPFSTPTSEVGLRSAMAWLDQQ